MRKRELVSLVMIIILAGVGISAVTGQVTDISSFGSFPDKQAMENIESYREALQMYDGFTQEEIDKIMENRPENFGKQSISVSILENKAPGVPAVYEEQGTGAANAVTGILWDYRGYDTLGEATVIFVAVGGVALLFRESGKEEEE